MVYLVDGRDGSELVICVLAVERGLFLDDSTYVTDKVVCTVDLLCLRRGQRQLLAVTHIW